MLATAPLFFAQKVVNCSTYLELLAIIVNFALMYRWIYILLLSFCSFIGWQGEAIASNSDSINKVELIADRYVEQLECAHRYNNFANRSHSITIPATSISTVGTRGQQMRLCADSATLTSIASGVIYSIEFSLYRICSGRAIDYYLYTLCCLRL